MGVLGELISNSFYFTSVRWSWKNWFLTVSILREYVVVLKELIFNSFYFGRVWGWLWKNWFLTVSSLGACDAVLNEPISNSFYFIKDVVVLRELQFKQFLLWEGVMTVKWLWKNWFLTVSILEGVVVLRELILNSFYFGRVWWSWKNWFLTVST